MGALVIAALTVPAKAGDSTPVSSSTPTQTHARAVAPEENVPAKVFRYAERLLRRYDRNGDRVLQADEWSKMHGNPQAADANRDRVITLDELTRHIVDFGRRRRVNLTYLASGEGTDVLDVGTAREVRNVNNGGGDAPQEADAPSPAAANGPGLSRAGRSSSRDAKFYVRPSRMPAGLPDWFTHRDTDGDGQLSLSEYAASPTQADLEEFARYDTNGDGLVTAKEYLAAVRPAKKAGAKGHAGKIDDKSGKKPSPERSANTAKKPPAN